MNRFSRVFCLVFLAIPVRFAAAAEDPAGLPTLDRTRAITVVTGAGIASTMLTDQEAQKLGEIRKAKNPLRAKAEKASARTLRLGTFASALSMVSATAMLLMAPPAEIAAVSENNVKDLAGKASPESSASETAATSNGSALR